MPSDLGDGRLYINLLFCVILIFINALIIASGKALDLADRSTLKELRGENIDVKRITLVLVLTERPNRYRYSNTAISYILFLTGAIIVNSSIIAFENFKIILVANLIYVFAWLVLSDFLPRRLAVQISETCAVRLVHFQKVICGIAWIVVKPSILFSNIFLVLFRKETNVDDTSFSEDRIRSMIDRGTEVGELKEEANKMIDSIFEFDDLLAYEIMTPRTDVFMIDLTDDREEYFDELMELKYSRIPVCDGDSDNVVGILHIKDYLLQAVRLGFDAVDIRGILRQPYLVPETKNIDTLFVELQKQKQHVAILIDEYGGFSGIATLEDLIEQIVGEIDDEFDEDDRVIKKVNNNTYVVDGNVYIDDLDEALDINLESDTSETIGGYIIDMMGEIPKEDETYSPIIQGPYTFSVLEVRDHRIEKIKIEIREEEPHNGENIKHK